MGTDRLAGLPDPVVEPVPPISVRRGITFIGPACCAKIRLANINGMVIGCCPDHSPIVVRDGDIIHLEAMPHG